jgi:asparagine synthase (glutamine-hydrolysing)
MGDFLALHWPRPAAAEPDARDLVACIEATGDWRRAIAASGLRIWVRGRRAPPIRQLAGDVWLIGDAFARQATRPVSAAVTTGAATPVAAALALSREAWGRYVALFPGDEAIAVFRDPSGGLDALAWRRGTASVVTSCADALPTALMPARCALDWGAIGGWLVDVGSAALASGLDGVYPTPPGCLLQQDADGASVHPVWKPHEHATPRSGAPADIAAGLVEAVDLAVRGLCAPYDRLVAELSGGLDSAVVGASMVRLGLEGRVCGWLNYFGDRPEGDERPYASDVAGHLGLPLTCIAKQPVALTEGDFAELASGLRPGFGGLDAERDRDTAARLEGAGAQGLLSGQGGDAVFFQMPTPLIAADQAGLGGVFSLRPALVADIARLSRRSAWSVLEVVRRDLRRPGPDMFLDPALVPGAHAERGWANPWVADAQGLAPGKRQQIAGLFQTQVSRGRSRRRQAGDLIYPLLSQPVVEYCLGLSTLQLTEGRRDRALARRAFRGRLPASVVDRRSKGDLTAHYGRSVAASLGMLRPLLLEGCLCEAGLLDRRELEAALTPARLIQEARSGDILIAAAVESWVRWWQGRIPDSLAAARPRPQGPG